MLPFNNGAIEFNRLDAVNGGKSGATWFRILFADEGESGFKNGFLLLRDFLRTVASAPAHCKRLSGLNIKIHNQTQLSTDGFGSVAEDESPGQITFQVHGDTSPCIHPTDLKHPDRRGFPCLRLQRAPPDFDLGAELNHEARAEAKAGKIVMIPQYEGAWFHLRAILRAL